MSRSNAYDRESAESKKRRQDRLQLRRVDVDRIRSRWLSRLANRPNQWQSAGMGRAEAASWTPFQFQQRGRMQDKSFVPAIAFRAVGDAVIAQI